MKSKLNTHQLAQSKLAEIHSDISTFRYVNVAISMDLIFFYYILCEIIAYKKNCSSINQDSFSSIVLSYYIIFEVEK